MTTPDQTLGQSNQEDETFLFSKMGAVVNFWRDVYISYWPYKQPKIPRQQHISRKPTTTRAGFMSDRRGRHWKRNRL